MKEFIPRLVVLELTRRCVLNCIHCRASANENNVDELSTEEWFKVLDDISSFSNPIIILSGGEALLREDVFDIIVYCGRRDLKVVLATCGAPLNKEKAYRLKQSGIKRVSVSLDGMDAKTHDFIRREPGSFRMTLKAIEFLKLYGIEFQVNTTVTRYNFKELDGILDLAIRLGAKGFHPFFMVPVGRASDIADKGLDRAEYELSLNRLKQLSLNSSIHCRPTCAPHYFRIFNGFYNRYESHSLDAITSGCLGGKSFAFISSEGKVQICGFLEVECGDVRKNSFKDIWRNSNIFLNLRNFNNYKGKCSVCEYLRICGGCRARAYETFGDYLEEEPECIYQPLNVGF